MKADMEQFGAGLAELTKRLDAYIVQLEEKLETVTAERDQQKNLALENEKRGREFALRLQSEVRGQYAARMTALYGALLSPPGWPGVAVTVKDAPELTHFAVVDESRKLVWSWGRRDLAVKVVVTREGLNGLLRFERNPDIEIVSGEKELMNLWILQDETALKALLTAPQPLLRPSATP